MLCDKDPTIASLWLYLTRVSADEILGLPDLAPEQTTRELTCAPEAKSLIGFWLNKGSVRPEIRPSSWMRDHWPKSQWGAEIRARVARQLPAIAHWQVMCGDYWQVGDDEATYFVDPPYRVAGHRYRYSCKAVDYSALATWCRSRRGQVIVCENEGADWLPFHTPSAVKGQAKTCRPEVVWLSPNLPAMPA